MSLTTTKSLLSAVVAVLLALCLTAPALRADARAGGATDPAGDGPGATTDLLAGTVAYDSAGRLLVTATASAPLERTGNILIASVKTYIPFLGCAGAEADLVGAADRPQGSLQVAGYSGLEPITVSVKGATIQLAASSPKLANQDYTCTTLSLGPATMTTFDVLDTPMYFSGFGPDSDGDGIVDNRDLCAGDPGPASNSGCPVVLPPPEPAVVIELPAEPAQEPPALTLPPVSTTEASSEEPALSPAERKYRERIKSCGKLRGRAKSACVRRAKHIRALTACSKLRRGAKQASCVRAADRRYRA